MNLERRKQLLQLVYKYQVPILEDDAYGDLRYEGNNLPPLKALDQYGYVLYLGSFSKIMFPGLRIGWIAATQPVIHQFTLAKQMADLHSNSLGQWIMNDLVRRGVYAKRVATLKKENIKCREIMTEALERFGTRGLEWSKPEGGLYFWCRLPETVDITSLIAKAAAKKVVFVPGYIFYSENYGHQNYIRLSFTSPAPEQIGPGIKALNQAIKETLGEQNQVDLKYGIEIKPIL
jgi:DNA-binding transcriptional MocR family regulator